jgi:hypothetical protein
MPSGRYHNLLICPFPFYYIGHVRKFSAILILSILLVNAAGFYAYYIVQLQQIHMEMRKTLRLLPDGELEILRLSKKEYAEARVDEHEVKVHGKMYDIARKKFSEDSVVVYALHDEKEDHLLLLLEEIISKPLKDRSSMPVAIVQFLTLLFVQPQGVGTTVFFPITSVSFLNSYWFSMQTAITSMDSPPPRAA